MRISDWSSDVCSSDLVLRGPQGTLFGKNTTAGVFSVYTKGPTPEFSGDFNASYANPEELRLEAGAGGMFADWGGLRVSLLDVDHKGGELKNTASGRSFDDMSQLAGRVKLLQIGRASCRERVCQYV